MQPSRLLQLNEVVGISAKTNSNSVEYVKQRVRLVLDYVAEQDREASEEQGRSDVDVFSSKLIEHNVQLL